LFRVRVWGFCFWFRVRFRVFCFWIRVRLRVFCFWFRVRFRVFTATFINISVMSWWSVLLVEYTGVPGENHWPVASYWQTLSVVAASRVYLFCSLQSRTRTHAALVIGLYELLGNPVYQLLSRGRWFSPDTADYSTTKTCRSTWTHYTDSKPAFLSSRAWNRVFSWNQSLVRSARVPHPISTAFKASPLTITPPMRFLWIEKK
jgi:hypothetical protein